MADYMKDNLTTNRADLSDEEVAETLKTEIGNLGEAFIDNDTQVGTNAEQYRTLTEAVDERPIEADDVVGYAGAYEDDPVLDPKVDAEGPMTTDFLYPAPGQALNADEEPGGMYGSTADELMGSPGPDAIDLGDTTTDTSGVTGSFRELGLDTIVELQGPQNIEPSTSIEDQLTTDLPIGGTYGVREDVIDPETGELTDYDDTPENEDT